MYYVTAIIFSLFMAGVAADNENSYHRPEKERQASVVFWVVLVILLIPSLYIAREFTANIPLP